MGVKGLWGILKVSEEKVYLKEMKGKVLALDAACWARTGFGLRFKETKQRRHSYCCERLIHFMGIPYLVAEGEAEKTAAWLDMEGIVDGVITEDSDAFLYGAQTVYRQLSTGHKNFSALRYRMSNIKLATGYSRTHLIALALMIGCDTFPGGGQRLGLKKALKILQNKRSDMDVMGLVKIFIEPARWKNISMCLKDFLHPPELQDFVFTELEAPKIEDFMCLSNCLWGWTEKQALKAFGPLLIRWTLEKSKSENIPFLSVKLLHSSGWHEDLPVHTLTFCVKADMWSGSAHQNKEKQAKKADLNAPGWHPESAFPKNSTQTVDIREWFQQWQYVDSRKTLPRLDAVRLRQERVFTRTDVEVVSNWQMSYKGVQVEVLFRL
ncbi:flap endonuclease GEN-like isoform X2 [Oratosquilla oratoria]|uniref:flap endonuclease GEN-like isoform X2 n=1 Tax=Oratosquilla oratoria TaxID=337810 RepID=UPI003F757F8F